MIYIYTIGCPACNVLIKKIVQKDLQATLIQDQKTFDELNKTAKRLYSPFDAIGINRLVEQKINKKDLKILQKEKLLCLF